MKLETEITRPAGASATSRQWTARVRRSAESAFPPDRLLPDTPTRLHGLMDLCLRRSERRQPCLGDHHRLRTRRSWARAGGTSPPPVTSSTHCTCGASELFFFFMVVHLWGKFFMAAWRGNRRLTWATGRDLVLGLRRLPPSPATCPSRTSTHSGSPRRPRTASTPRARAPFWNVLNFGQMLMWHIVLLPIAVVVIAGPPCPLVRRRVSCRPFDSRPARPAPMTTKACDDACRGVASNGKTA